jgi:hypothetical protein
MLTKVPLTEEEITRLRTHLSIKSLIKYMSWVERILFLIPLLVLLAALIMILVSSDSLLLLVCSPKSPDLGVLCFWSPTNCIHSISLVRILPYLLPN